MLKQKYYLVYRQQYSLNYPVTLKAMQYVLYVTQFCWTVSYRRSNTWGAIWGQRKYPETEGNVVIL